MLAGLHVFNWRSIGMTRVMIRTVTPGLDFGMLAGLRVFWMLAGLHVFNWRSIGVTRAMIRTVTPGLDFDMLAGLCVFSSILFTDSATQEFVHFILMLAGLRVFFVLIHPRGDDNILTSSRKIHLGGDCLGENVGCWKNDRCVGCRRVSI
jgi:hypothetical protein